MPNIPLRSKAESSIIHRIGLKYMMSDREIENIVKSQFEVVKEAIYNGNRDTIEFKNCQILNFCKFFVSDTKKQSQLKKNEDKLRLQTEKNNDRGADNGDGAECIVE